MKTPTSPLHLFWSTLLVATLSLSVASAADKADSTKNRMRTLEKDLDKVRDSLHEAQRELAAKGERIEDLEKDLAAARKIKAEAPAEKRKPGKPAPGKKEIVKKEEPKKPAAAPKPAARLFAISYEKNSAANYEGRDAALAWVREQLKRDPKLGLRISGSANDSEYPEVSKLVAGNRARYLADYFILSGVPGEAIVSVEGSVAKSEGEGGRSVRVLVIERDAKKDGGGAE